MVVLHGPERLIQLRADLGHRTPTAFARAARIDPQHYSALEANHCSPKRPNGLWTKTARKVAAYHGVGIGEIWGHPEVCVGIHAVVELQAAGGEGVPSAEEAVLKRELIPLVREGAEQLDHARSREALIAYYGLRDGCLPQSYARVGKQLGIKKARAQELVRKAERALYRHWHSSLRSYVQEGAPWPTAREQAEEHRRHEAQEAKKKWIEDERARRKEELCGSASDIFFAGHQQQGGSLWWSRDCPCQACQEILKIHDTHPHRHAWSGHPEAWKGEVQHAYFRSHHTPRGGVGWFNPHCHCHICTRICVIWKDLIIEARLDERPPYWRKRPYRP